MRAARGWMTMGFLGVYALALAACGGGGGGGGNPQTPSPTYSVNATVSGLAGTGLQLANGSNTASVATNGTVTFSTSLATGATYAVTVTAQPTAPWQTCVVSNGTGTIASANVTNIVVSCTTNTYAVGGTVSGLSGSGLALQNNATNEIAVAANGSLSFPPAASGSTYDISVSGVPNNPVQKCTVSNGAGTVTNAAINVGVQCVTQTPRFAYALNFYGGSVSIYNVDAATGQWRMRGYAKTGQSPITGVSDSGFNYTYVLNTGVAQNPPSLAPLTATNASITAFRHDNNTGAQVEVAGSPYPLPFTLGTTAPAGRIAMHPNDKFLYVPDSTGNGSTIIGYAVNSNTGALSSIASPFPAGAAPAVVRFNAQGTFAYVPNRNSNDVSLFTVNTTTGVLTEVLPRALAGVGPATLRIHPNGRLAYVVNLGSSNISAYTINSSTGVLTPVTGGPYPVPAVVAEEPLEFHPTGSFAYLRSVGTSGGNGAISGFAVNQTTGALTPLSGSPYALGVNSLGSIALSMHPTGKFLYMANRSTGVGPTSVGSISAFSISATTGVLTPIAGIDTLQPAPLYGVVDPSGKYLYVSSIEGDLIYSYQIDDASGALTRLPVGGVIRSGAEPARTFGVRFARNRCTNGVPIEVRVCPQSWRQQHRELLDERDER